MKVTVTSGAADRRLATPAELVALNGELTTATARTWLDRAAAVVAGGTGLQYPPWRQSYSLRLGGTDSTEMGLYAKPVESATVTDLDANAIATTDYTLIGNGTGILDRLERSDGWPRRFTGAFGISQTANPVSETDAFIATTTAGWLMPGQTGDWTAATAYKATLGTTSRDDPATSVPYVVGSWVRSTDPRVVLRFECTAAGTTGATEPAGFTASATVAGDTITDNTATWTARGAVELPDDLSNAALELALALFEGAGQSRQTRIEATGDSMERVEFMTASEMTAAIPGSILEVFEAYR